MYINLEKPKKDIKFGDIVIYENETCLIINANGFRTEAFPVLVISLTRGKVLNAFKDLEFLNKSSCELIARESSVELRLIQNVEGY